MLKPEFGAETEAEVTVKFGAVSDVPKLNTGAEVAVATGRSFAAPKTTDAVAGTDAEGMSKPDAVFGALFEAAELFSEPNATPGADFGAASVAVLLLLPDPKKLSLEEDFGADFEDSPNEILEGILLRRGLISVLEEFEEVFPNSNLNPPTLGLEVVEKDGGGLEVAAPNISPMGSGGGSDVFSAMLGAFDMKLNIFEAVFGEEAVAEDSEDVLSVIVFELEEVPNEKVGGTASTAEQIGALDWTLVVRTVEVPKLTFDALDVNGLTFGETIPKIEDGVFVCFSSSCVCFSGVLLLSVASFVFSASSFSLGMSNLTCLSCFCLFLGEIMDTMFLFASHVVGFSTTAPESVSSSGESKLARFRGINTGSFPVRAPKSIANLFFRAISNGSTSNTGTFGSNPGQFLIIFRLG